MTNGMNNLFEATEVTATSSNRGLNGTAQLTSMSATIVEAIITAINEDLESYSTILEDSKSDNDRMDSLINMAYDLTGADTSFLETLTDEALESMLKSQQSKRSRCKSKTMTLDNYKSMMNAAVAENIIRMVTGKEKSKGGYHRSGSAVDYTIEQLEELGADQERLNKEIRNIQSKKSIMKSKADFDEASERYQSLLRAETTLKDLRTGKSVQVVEVDTTKDALKELLADTDLNELHAKDSKELLAKIAEMLGAE